MDLFEFEELALPSNVMGDIQKINDCHARRCIVSGIEPLHVDPHPSGEKPTHFELATYNSIDVNNARGALIVAAGKYLSVDFSSEPTLPISDTQSVLAALTKGIIFLKRPPK